MLRRSSSSPRSCEKHDEFVIPSGPHAEPLVIAESEFDMCIRRGSRLEGQ